MERRCTIKEAMIIKPIYGSTASPVVRQCSSFSWAAGARARIVRRSLRQILTLPIRKSRRSLREDLAEESIAVDSGHAALLQSRYDGSMSLEESFPIIAQESNGVDWHG